MLKDNNKNMQKKHSSCCIMHVDVPWVFYIGVYISKAGVATSTITIEAASHVHIENQLQLFFHGRMVSGMVDLTGVCMYVCSFILTRVDEAD